MGNNLKAKENALKNYEKTLKYLDKELEIIEMSGYDVGPNFLEQFPERAKDFILGIDRGNNSSEIEELSKEIKESNLVERTLYLLKVANSLKEKSKLTKYKSVNGSFWEDIGFTLKQLALEIEEKI